MHEAKVLITDDDIEVGTFFRRLLQKQGCSISVAANGGEANRLIHETSFNAAVVDMKLPDVDGVSLVRQIKNLQPKCEVIIMTGISTNRTAVKAMQLGAFDYIEKPFEDIDKVESLIQRAVEYGRRGNNVRHVNTEWADIADRVGFRVGSSQAMHKLVSIAYTVAKKNFNILIRGETGTGKEVLARFIHAASNRSKQIFIPVNCGALPENLLESELFGHEKGAFTGAANMRKGIFEMSNGGTLFLDEVGDSSLAIQVKLLRVLETGEFLRVGGEKWIKTDVRVIAATNRDLEQSLKDKTFREDLFYRLDVVRLELPPLRERREDIPILVEYFINKLNSELYVSNDTMHLLCNYAWPGNIRELSNTISRAVALCDGKIILPEHLSPKLRSSVAEKPAVIQELYLASGRAVHVSPQSLEDFLEKYLSENILESIEHGRLPNLMKLLRRLESSLAVTMRKKGIETAPFTSMEIIEAEAIRAALDFYRGNVTMAAKALGIGRNTLYRKLKEYDAKRAGSSE